MPPIDAQTCFNPSPEYACELLDTLQRFYTREQIAAHAGVSKRNLSYIRRRGFFSYPTQLALELLVPIDVEI